MPRYIDVHKNMKGVNLKDVAEAHAKDLRGAGEVWSKLPKVLVRREGRDHILPLHRAEQGSHSQCPQRGSRTPPAGKVRSPRRRLGPAAGLLFCEELLLNCIYHLRLNHVFQKGVWTRLEGVVGLRTMTLCTSPTTTTSGASQSMMTG